MRITKKEIEQLPRCDSKQTDGFFLTLALRKTAMFVVDEIPERLKAVGQYDAVKSIIDISDMASDALLQTYPEAKQTTMIRQADHLRVFLRSIADPTGVKGCTYVDSDALGVLIAGTHEICKLCSHPRRCKSCEYGRALDKVSPKERKKGESWADINVAED